MEHRTAAGQTAARRVFSGPLAAAAPPTILLGGLLTLVLLGSLIALYAHAPRTALVGLLALALVLGLTLAWERAHAVRNRERTLELVQLATHLQRATEHERAELARRLHDELGGLLTAAKMDLSWLQTRVDVPLAQQRLEQLGVVLDEAMALKRRVVEQLRPSLLDHFGLATALRSYVAATTRAAGLECHLDIPEESERVPGEVALALFRVTEEGLSNVLRHAGARLVSVRLTTGPQGYELLLRDDGRGLEGRMRGKGKHGLSAITHRVRSLGGELEVSSAPGGGTQLRAKVPRLA